ncbi:MAG TPA: hypothetical protein VFZ34_20860 [Blastocatellia bacterium]|nr:hypothetical protein [Blastocatellia bacterium]
MSAVLTSLDTPQKTDQGWVIDIPPDMADVMGVAHGSIGILYPRPDGISIEVIPPLAPDLMESVKEICEQFREDFEEMKRLGD